MSLAVSFTCANKLLRQSIKSKRLSKWKCVTKYR